VIANIKIFSFAPKGCVYVNCIADTFLVSVDSTHPQLKFRCYRALLEAKVDYKGINEIN